MANRLIEQLTKEINTTPNNPELYIARAMAYKKEGLQHDALNDFLRASDLDPNNKEVLEQIKMIREIFEFCYMQQYNP